MISKKRSTPAVIVRTINSRQQNVDLDRMVPVPADHFSLEELTWVYNKARIDYLIPMPMATHRLQEYISAYDIALNHSCVMLDTILSEPVGLGLLGLRSKRAWISRFGLVPLVRGQGLGSAMMAQLIETADQRGAETILLELIQENRSGFRLAEQFDFNPLRELIVARRPPDLNRSITLDPAAQIEEESGLEALRWLNGRNDQPSWLNETETFITLEPAGLHSLSWKHPDGRAGWAVYESDRYQFKRVTVGVESGDEAAVTAQVLNALHLRYPRKDAVIEDMPLDDPRWAGYQAAGYFETFRRIELKKDQRPETRE
ncbi:MAG: GNAT family N-acetyltransferase [Ardenticatenaceae bacterium]|nr:GNAT family N-acetyltransferase [Ardenticatenaceae bacterium]